jgi:hypothetical protein
MEVIDKDSLKRWAYEQVTGGNSEHTCEALADFMQCMTEERTPTDVAFASSLLRSKASDYELISIMFDRRASDLVIAAATRELARRFLDADGTKAVIKRICLEMGK